MNKNKHKERQIFSKEITFGLISAFAAFCIYIPVFNYGFVDWDDPQMLLGNVLVREISFEGIKNIFSEYVNENYHPLTVLSYTFEYAFAGYSPKLYHVINVLFHSVNAFLVFKLIQLLFKNHTVSLIGSLLFAVHPMHVESVAWVTERKDVLFAFFFLLSLIEYLKFCTSNKSKHYYFTLLYFVLSLLSKAQAVTLPIVLILFDWYLNKGVHHRKVIFQKVPFFILSLIFGLITANAASSSGIIVYAEKYTLLERLMFAGYSAWIYIFKFIAPLNLSCVYPYPEKINDSYSILIILAPFLIIVFTAGILFYFRKKREFLFGILFFFANIVLMLQILPVGHAFIADRFTYVAYIGFYVISGYYLAPVIQNKSNKNQNNRNFTIVFLIIVLSFFSFRTWERCKAWQSSESLWNDAVKKYPEMPMIQNHAGALYIFSDFSKALKCFEKAITLDPEYQHAHNNIGIVYYNQQKYDLALQKFNDAIKIDEKFSLAIHNRGALYKVLGLTDKAFDDYSKAIELNPKYGQAYYNRAVIFTEKQNYKKAFEDALNAKKSGFAIDENFLKDLESKSSQK